MTMLFSLTGFTRLFLLFWIYHTECLGNRLPGNVSFCSSRRGGGSWSIQNPEAETSLDNISVSLSEVSQRLVIKFQYVADTTRNLKSSYAVNKIEDSSLLAVLATTSRLTGFPPNPTGGMVNDTLLNNFNGLQNILAFLRLAKKNEYSQVYKRRISAILNRVKGILCELSVLLRRRDISTDPIRFRMPNDYKTMTQTSRYSWIYILLRDVLEFFEGSITLYKSYSR